MLWIQPVSLGFVFPRPWEGILWLLMKLFNNSLQLFYQWYSLDWFIRASRSLWLGLPQTVLPALPLNLQELVGKEPKGKAGNFQVQSCPRLHPCLSHFLMLCSGTVFSLVNSVKWVGGYMVNTVCSWFKKERRGSVQFSNDFKANHWLLCEGGGQDHI